MAPGAPAACKVELWDGNDKRDGGQVGTTFVFSPDLSNWQSPRLSLHFRQIARHVHGMFHSILHGMLLVMLHIMLRDRSNGMRSMLHVALVK